MTKPSTPPASAPVASTDDSTCRVLFAASEVAPFAKTGGLADVVGSLPRALARRGCRCAVIMPLYNAVRQAKNPPQPTDHNVTVPVGGQMKTGRLWRGTLTNSDVPLYCIEHNDYFGRDDSKSNAGLYQYQTGHGELRDYDDNCARYVFFSRAVLEALPLLDEQPRILHLNDWQTGLIPVYLRELYRGRAPYDQLKTVFTIHNLAYQGAFGPGSMPITGLDWALFNFEKLEAYDSLNLMKAGIVYSDAITTVSPRYAEEIQTPEFACGLEEVLKAQRHKLTGIVNGVDYERWDPAHDSFLPQRYDAGSLVEGKASCKADLQERLNLPRRPDVPLLGIVSRLVDQKGIDVVLQAGPELVRHDVQLVVLGTGDPGLQNGLRRLADAYPRQVSGYVGFSEQVAHLIEAGADAFLMPSKYEPSGLNQLYSLKYGTVPIVRDTGGLSNTVTDTNPSTLTEGKATGFKFRYYSASALLAAVLRALVVYHAQKADWLQVQRTGMGQDWSWDQRAPEYVALYERVLGTSNTQAAPTA